jgi:hypothetical protein
MFWLHEDGTEAGNDLMLVLVCPRIGRKESAGQLGQREMKVVAGRGSKDLLRQPR